MAGERLTPNFTLAELIRSTEAHIKGLDNTPGPEHLANLRVTAYGLEAVRKLLALAIGRPVVVNVTSGYRSPAVNAAVGGTPTSAHALGLAADITVPGLTAIELARLLEDKLPYDQLILESSRGIVHISFDPRLRMQALTQKGAAGTAIVPGILA